MLCSGLPLTCCRSDTCDGLRKAEDRPKRHRFSADQLANQGVELSSLRLVAEHEEALDHKREQTPRASGVGLAAMRKPRALFVKDCECTVTITGVSHLSKKRSDAESLDRAFPLEEAGGLGMH